MRTKWEYRTVEVPDLTKLGATLAEPGHEGWELISVLPREDGKAVCVLKRPLQSEPARQPAGRTG